MGIELPSSGAPVWLQDLIRKVGDLLKPLGFLGQLGFRYLEPAAENNYAGRWVIAVYLVPHELLGGKQDGHAAISGFCFDVLKFVEFFSSVSALEWHVPREYTDGLTGPELWLEGIYETYPVQFHFYSESPSDELPSLVFDVVTRTAKPK